MKELLKRFLSLINVEYHERTGVFLLMFQAFFLGIFNGSFNIVVHSIFLEKFTAQPIPMAYIYSGLLAFAFTFLFFFLKSRFNFKSFIFYSIAFLFLLITVLSLNFVFTESDWSVYTAFLMVVPMNIITFHIFRNIINRLYSDHQNLRLSVIFEYSWEIGIVIISFFITFLLYLSLNFKFIFGFCIFSLFFTLILEYWVLKSFEFVKRQDRDIYRNPLIKKNLLNLIKDHYAVLIIVFLIIAAIINYTVHYSFLAVSVNNFESEIGLAKFFGVYTGTLTIFIFVADRVFLSRLLNNLGMPYSIILSPLIIGLFVLIAAILGSATGSISALGGYSFFFMLISLGKLMERTFEQSVNEPSVKILYQLVDEKNKPVIRELIYGTIGSLTIFISGLFILLFMSIKSFTVYHLLFVLLPVFVAWFILGVKLIQKYRERLKNKVSILKERAHKQKFAVHTGDLGKDIFMYFNDANPQKIKYLLRFFHQFIPFYFRRLILIYANSEFDEVREYVYNLIDENSIYEAGDIIRSSIENEKNSAIKSKGEKILFRFRKELEVDHTYESLADLVFSGNISDRLYVCHFLRIKGAKEHEGLINVLLKDIEPQIRTAAIEASSKLKTKESVITLIDYLLSPVYYKYAFYALSSYNKEAVELLDQLFYDNNMDTRVLERVVRIYGEIRSEKSVERLFAKFDSLNKFIHIQTVASLRKYNTNFKKVQTNVIIKQVVRRIEICAWNMAAHISSRRLRNNESLVKALNEEINSNIHDIFSLLTLLYDDSVIRYTEELVLKSKAEGVAYALEILDLFIDQDLRNVLFPLLQDLPLEVKVKQLQFYFPIEKKKPLDLLNAIINRDYNLISTWTKICAILCYYYLEYDEVTDDLVACIFSPEKLIQETAAFVIYQIDRERFHDVIKRVENTTRDELENSMGLLSYYDHHLVFKKFTYLKRIPLFENIKNDHLQELARSLNIIDIKAGEYVEFTNQNSNIPVIFTTEGHYKIFLDSQQINDIYDVNIIDLLSLTYKNNQRIAIYSSRDSYIYVIEREVLNYHLFDRRDMLFALIWHFDSNFSLLNINNITAMKTTK